jgi:mannose-6-phosphate isomerase-like protein (cupin superfamily)
MNSQAAVRALTDVPARTVSPGVTASELLADSQGCRNLHQRRLHFAGAHADLGDAVLTGAASGLGESWYVINGAGSLEVADSEITPLRPGTAVWLRRSVSYRCQGNSGSGLEILAISVRAGSPDEDAGPAVRMASLDECEPERTGDREFRVLLSAGLAITQFFGIIPPGRAPAHHHTYDEVVHVLGGQGVVHLGATEAEILPGTSIYLPPHQPHCLENTGAGPLTVLGVFYPAGSPASKHLSAAPAN